MRIFLPFPLVKMERALLYFCCCCFCWLFFSPPLVHWDGRTGAREEPDLRDACTKLVVSSVGVKGREGGRRAEEEQAIEKRRGSPACPCLSVLGREGERRAPSLRPSELGSESSSSRQSFASLGRSSTCVRSVPLFSCAPLTFTYSFVLLPTAIIAIIIQIL